VESDPIGLKGGSYSTYAYVNGAPTMHSDATGLLQQCSSGLDALHGGSLGIFHHEFQCWTDENGKRVCRGFGRDPNSPKYKAIFGDVDGKILKDGENFSYGKGTCSPDDGNKCMDDCASDRWNSLEERTPLYGWIDSSTCQTIVEKIQNYCESICGIKAKDELYF